MKNVILNWSQGAYRNFSRVPFIFVLILIEIYFFINGSAHFPNWDSGYGNLIMIYIMMTLFFLVWAKRSTERQMDRPFKDSIIWFVFFFIGTYIFMLFASALGLFSAPTLPGSLFWPTVIVQICVVATAEELMFRGVILSWFGIIISAILFAFWHGYAYGMVYYQGQFMWSSVAFALVMGLILGLIAKHPKWGIVACIGVHSCYNCYISGIFMSF